MAADRVAEDREGADEILLSNLPEAISLRQLVATAKLRWRIERDYQELKQESDWGHYEGRNWRGFHHHATLCIAAMFPGAGAVPFSPAQVAATRAVDTPASPTPCATQLHARGAAGADRTA